MLTRSLCIAAVAAILSLVSTATAAPRDVQIVNLDFESQIIELFNFGSDTEPLDGWRFCSHDESVTRRYSAPSGLNGVSIASGESLFIHLLSDSGGAANSIDRPAGNFAEPLTPDSYGLQIYFSPVSFSDGETIADHVQWSIDGIDNTSADERSDEAESGDVWTDQSLWAATASDSTSLMLVESANGLELHGPADYEAVPEPSIAFGLAAGLLGLVRFARR